MYNILIGKFTRKSHKFKKILIYQEETNMKSTGIVRKIDELGRIVLPIELRRTLGISEKDSLEIYVDQDAVILKKYKSSCTFCSSNENLIGYKGKSICQECMNDLKK